MCCWKSRCSQDSLVFETFWKEERVISALSKLKWSFHHWRTRYENPLDCLERPSCETQEMMGSLGSERSFTTEGAGPASSSSALVT